MNYKELNEKRNAKIAELEALKAFVDSEKRSLNADELEKFKTISDEIRSIDDTIAAFESIPAPAGEERSAGEQLTVEEMEMRSFAAYIRENRTEKMDTTSNGAVIPSTIANKIVTKVREISPIYDRATRYNFGGTLTIPYYDESTEAITMAYATEFTDLTSTSGKIQSISLTGYLAGALTKVSLSLLNNSDFDLVNFVIDRMAESVALFVEGEVLNGTSGKIRGIADETPKVTAASATAVTSDELIELQESVPDAYQANCIWVMSRSTRTAIRQLKDGQGNYLLNKDATAQWGYSLFGHPVYVSEKMPDMASGKNAIVYLDCSGLAVKVVETASATVLREKFADQHAIGVVAWMEVDSKVENSQKVAVLKMG